GRHGHRLIPDTGHTSRSNRCWGAVLHPAVQCSSPTARRCPWPEHRRPRTSRHPRISAITDRNHTMTDHGTVSRRGLFRAGGIGLAAIAFGPALAACSRTEDTVTLDSLRKQGFIQVAINNEAPFGYIDEYGE